VCVSVCVCHSVCYQWCIWLQTPCTANMPRVFVKVRHRQCPDTSLKLSSEFQFWRVGWKLQLMTFCDLIQVHPVLVVMFVNDRLKFVAIASACSAFVNHVHRLQSLLIFLEITPAQTM